MNEQEQKAIKWMQNVRDGAVVTLDHIAKNEPSVSPILYTGRKEKAETIIKGFEELKQYRAIGTVDELQKLKDGITYCKDCQHYSKDYCYLREANGFILYCEPYDFCRYGIRKIDWGNDSE